MSGPDWWVCDKHKTSGILEPGSYCKGCSDEREAVRDALEHSARTYRSLWSVLDGIMVEAGMDAKATPEEAQKWLRTELQKVGILKELLREIQWGAAPDSAGSECPYCLSTRRRGHGKECEIRRYVCESDDSTIEG